MIRVMSIALQFILLLVTFLVGSFLPIFHVLPMERIQTGPARYFVLDGLFCVFGVYLIILLIELFMGRLRRSGISTTLALLLALALGFLLRFPFMGTG
jgi:hypothetical protein